MDSPSLALRLIAETLGTFLFFFLGFNAIAVSVDIGPAAIEGLGIAVMPTAIVESEMADGRLQLLSTDLQLPQLTFSASWLASPDTVAVERVAELAANLAQGGVIVDAPRQARH